MRSIKEINEDLKHIRFEPRKKNTKHSQEKVLFSSFRHLSPRIPTVKYNNFSNIDANFVPRTIKKVE